MSLFKAGDRVRCINDDGLDAIDGIRLGECATVVRADLFVYFPWTRGGCGLSAGRFELVQSGASSTLPTSAAERKDIPLVRGCLDYFPAALAEVAKVSKAGNDQHNPGEEMHHARGKSTDHVDCIVRHLVDRGSLDTDGQRHTAKAAWRALALLQEELEAAGAPMARGAK